MIAWLRSPLGAGIAALLLLILIASSFVIVRETQQAVVLRLEKPIYTVNEWREGQGFGGSGAGPILKVPLLDRVVLIDKRVLDVDLEGQPVLSTDQLRLEVDAFARFRIINPLRAVLATGSGGSTEASVADALKPLLGSALRNELGKRRFDVLLSPERGAVMENIRRRLQANATQYGVRIVDVRIRHADLPQGSPLDSALERMRTARQQQAATIQAQGEKQAQIIRAEADAQAAQIYAQAGTKDPEFFDFYLAMQSYRNTFAASTSQSETQVILSPNDEYMRQFYGRGRPRGQ